MFQQSAYRSDVAESSMTLSSLEADGSHDAALAACIRDARQSKRFAHEENVKSWNVGRWLDRSEARHELRCTLEWLKNLLPGTGEEAAVRSRVAHLAGIVDHARWFDSDLHELYGATKRNLLKLCERLEEDQRPSTVALACRELHPICLAMERRDAMKTIKRAIKGAISAVEKESPRAAGHVDSGAQAPRPVPDPRRLLLSGLTTLAVPSPCAPAAVPLPKSDDAALTQALTAMGAQGVRVSYAQLGAAFDRLVTLMPPGTDPLLKNGVIAWRDSYAAPANGFGRADAEMLLGGRLMLTALCNELDKLDRDHRRDVFRCLAWLMPQELVHPKARSCSLGSHVSMLAQALVTAEGIRDDDNPHLAERRMCFEALTAPLRKRSQVTEHDVLHGMVELGLDLDSDIEGAGSKMHPVYTNAAWQACLKGVLGPIELHPLADVDKAGLVLALEKPRQDSEALHADVEGALSGRHDDKGDARREVAADAWRRINQRISAGTPEERRELLDDILMLTQKAEDPVALLRRLAG